MPGQAGILEEINKTYIHSINELPYSPGIPEKNIQTSGHVSGWVDIVGFRQMMRDNGTDYIPGIPANLAIVQYDAKANDVPGSITRIDKSITIYESNNFTIAVLNVDLHWKSTICSKNSCWEVPHHDTAQFQDTEVSPSLFIFPTKQAITIEQYKGIVPKNIIKFRDMDEGIISYRVTTRNGSVLHRRKIGMIETTQKGVFFMNLTPLSEWEKTGSGIYHWRDDPIMGDDKITNITFDTPYGPAPNIDYSNGMVYHENKETNIQPGVWSVLYVVLIFFAGIYIMYKSSGS